MELLWFTFDIIGTIAFAISGTLVGIGRRMDIFGMLVLALATAIGGGIMRDLMVGNIPPNSLRTFTYVFIVMAVTFGVFFIYRVRRAHYIGTRWVRRMYLGADTLGLASFTVTGAGIGVYSYPEMPVLAVILGLLTAVGGGVIRDILAQRVPSVLREEVYALPAIIGGIVYYGFYHMGQWQLASYSAFIIVVVIRTLALRYNWSLPRIR
ncbi:trimeric intracellular cation channel family protein [Veillonella criceti]|uniref:Predicted membrane protein n=1 Tax=Veillonella criceti TaxID=103891 RepID=A0A380NMK0_9FIRM|nr:trimeric intracellular cation channel family protein [Veillonella criceti]SUP43038.1 Predicted membrane protein [Veillonella criceti]